MSSPRHVSQRLCGLWLMYIGVIVMLAVWFSGSDLLNVVLLGIGYVIGYVLIFMLPYASRRLVIGKSDRFQDIWDNISLGFMVIGCTLVGMLVGFDDVRLAWLLIFLVVGIHFIGFYFSQGMSMVILGVLTIVGEFGIGGLNREVFDRVLDEFLDEFRTARAINSGSCGEFAHCVNEAYRSSGLSYHVVFTTFDFLWSEPSDGLCEVIDRWDSRKMSMFGVSVEEFELYKRDVYRMDSRGYVGYHVFLYDGERYYDAECSEGVTSVLDLPFYRSFR